MRTFDGSRPELETLDPGADVSANVQKVRAGVLPRSEWIARTGWDAEQIDAEIAADNARADRLGLVLDTDPRKITLQGQEQHVRNRAGEAATDADANTPPEVRAPRIPTTFGLTPEGICRALRKIGRQVTFQPLRGTS